MDGRPFILANTPKPPGGALLAAWRFPEDQQGIIDIGVFMQSPAGCRGDHRRELQGGPRASLCPVTRSIGVKPHRLYELPKCSKVEKIQDALLCECPIAGVVQPSLLCLAVFQVLPLTLLWMLEISKNVFGNNIIDATISHGILIVTYSMGLVRLYSFKQITEKAKNGIQEMNCCSMESDWIYFHPDDSGRIIHVGPGKINMLKLTEIHDSQYQVMQDYIIVAARENKANQKITVTSSGRVVKKRYNQLDDDPEQETFKIVEYEDELDLLATVAVTQTEADGKALVRLHDNQTGVLIKEINLEESWDVTHSNELFFDRDTIVHLENLPNRNYTCYVYKMIRHFQDED
ncbi:DCA17 factor, partial [Polypterus senegalus]